MRRDGCLKKSIFDSYMLLMLYYVAEIEKISCINIPWANTGRDWLPQGQEPSDTWARSTERTRSKPKRSNFSAKNAVTHPSGSFEPNRIRPIEGILSGRFEEADLASSGCFGSGVAIYAFVSFRSFY